MIGRTLGRYEIVEKLGEGGMGEVWLARDTRLDREVAIKVLPPSSIADDERRARLRREAMSLSQLNHPNVATVFDFDSADGIDFLVMEHVDGEGLDRRLERGPLPEAEVVRLGVQLAAGLEAAHALGVVHRDLKPANLKETSDGRLKILDFGLAKLVAPVEETAATRTDSGPLKIAGTLPYMAPEQLRGRAIDARSDVYAAGAVLYEAITGRRAHPQESSVDVIDAVLNSRPERPSAAVGAVSRDLERVVMKALSKDPAERHASAAELRVELERLAAPDAASPLTWLRRPGVLAAIAIVVLVSGWLAHRQWRVVERERHAREVVIPGIEARIEDHNGFEGDAAGWEAFRLAREAADILGADDPRLASVVERFTRPMSLATDPPGARILARPPGDREAGWIDLGSTPADGVRLPTGLVQLRFELEGHAPHDDLVWNHAIFNDRFEVPLFPIDAVPDGMVWIRPVDGPLRLPGLESLEGESVPGFWADRHEVRNADFEAFVDAGGYDDPRWWREPIVLEGRTVDFEESRALFVDRTGRPGPATWEVGDPPEGGGDLPVGGVGWHEAAAYCAFVGKRLPTIYHWSAMAFPYAGPSILPTSNFDGAGPSPVGSRAAIHAGGAKDLAGNVREWCVNASNRAGQRFILGGGWSDAPYAFNDGYAQPALDRAEINGFRCVLAADGADGNARLAREIALPFRDFFAETPVDDATFELFRRQYAYDDTPLDSEVDWSRRVGDHRVERVTFEAGYGGERMVAYLALPDEREFSPPYQTVVLFPGSGVIHRRNPEHEPPRGLPEFLPRSGRVAVLPVFRGTLERGGDLTTDQPSETVRYRDYVRTWVQDLGRTIDYLETRDDIDAGALAYLGQSWGGRMGPLMLGVEPRFRAAVLNVAGLKFQRALPEADPFHYVSRVDVPVLMLNGRYDFFFPLETSQRPLFELLGTPDEDKRWVVYDGGHTVPRTELIGETLAWLDRYLGRVDARRAGERSPE